MSYVKTNANDKKKSARVSIHEKYADKSNFDFLYDCVCTNWTESYTRTIQTTGISDSHISPTGLNTRTTDTEGTVQAEGKGV